MLLVSRDEKEESQQIFLFIHTGTAMENRPDSRLLKLWYVSLFGMLCCSCWLVQNCKVETSRNGESKLQILWKCWVYELFFVDVGLIGDLSKIYLMLIVLGYQPMDSQRHWACVISPRSPIIDAKIAYLSRPHLYDFPS